MLGTVDIFENNSKQVHCCTHTYKASSKKKSILIDTVVSEYTGVQIFQKFFNN